MSKFKLDIFKVLKQIDLGDFSIWQNLSEEERKGFSALIIQRWLSGTSDEGQIIALNTFSNKMIFSLSKHPELLVKLLTACASRRQKRYHWISAKTSQKNTEALEVIKQYFGISSRDAKEYNLSPDELIMMAEEMGFQKDQMSKLKKELKI